MTQEDLIPPDLNQCQCEITDGNFMTLGGVRETKRCTNKPTTIIAEIEPGPDGLKGSMAVCDGCRVQAEKKLTNVEYRPISQEKS